MKIGFNAYRTAIAGFFAGMLVLAFTSSCNDKPYVPPWEWPDTTKTDTTEKDTTVKPDSLKPRFIWIDAAANFIDYANDSTKIYSDMKKVCETGFTDIVVDVRPSEGDVLFRTDNADPCTKLDVWNPDYKFHYRTATWDYLSVFIRAGHKAGLRVHAAFNTFTGGCHYPYGIGEQGMLFRDSSKKDWATCVNLSSGITNVMDLSGDDYGTKFLCPSNPDVVSFLISLLKDLAAYRNLDGIILDRCRYDDLAADFSDYSRTAFEKYLGQTVTNWPSDVLAPGTTSLPYTYPSLMKKWLEFRVKTIYDFVSQAATAVHAINPSIKFGCYVGGWYSSYYESGVNWGSNAYNTSSYYKWAGNDYSKYGYADIIDQLLIGAYASATSIYGTGEWTCQGFCKLATIVTVGNVKVYGGPDIGNWDTGGLSSSDLQSAVTSTVDACINSCDGYFVFDLIHVKDYNYWTALKSGIDAYKKTNSH